MFKQFGMKQLVASAMLLLLSACSTVGGDQEVTASYDVSIVKGSFNREGAFTWISFSLYSINGEKVPYGFFSAPPPIKLLPGKHTLVTLASFNNGMGAPSEAKIPMGVDLKAGSRYEINGTVLGARVEAWLDNVATKEKSSISFFAPWDKTYQAPTVIKLPAR